MKRQFKKLLSIIFLISAVFLAFYLNGRIQTGHGSLYARILLNRMADNIGFSINPIHNSQIKFSQYALTPSMSYSYGFSVGDFSGSGKPEIAYADSWVITRQLFRKKPEAILKIHSMANGSRVIFNEDMSFSELPATPVALLERQIAFDYDDDGDLDVVAVINSHGAVIVYVNPGIGGGEWERDVLTKNVNGVVNLAIEDIDGDGDADLVVAMRNNLGSVESNVAGVAWLENSRRTKNSNWILHDIDFWKGFKDVRTLLIAGVDDDELDDIIITDSGRAYVYVNRAKSGEWERGLIENIDTTGLTYGASHDINGDGKKDFIYANLSGLYWADFSKGWRTPLIEQIAAFTGTNNRVSDIAVGDIDLDGSIDIVYSFLGGSILWSQVKDKKWVSYWVDSMASRYVGITLSDHDSDGDLDVIANIEYDGNMIVLFENKLQ